MYSNLLRCLLHDVLGYGLGYVWVFKVVGMVLCMLYPSESVTHLDSPTSLSASADVISIHIDKVLRLLLFNMFTTVSVQALKLRSNTS